MSAPTPLRSCLGCNRDGRYGTSLRPLGKGVWLCIDCQASGASATGPQPNLTCDRDAPGEGGCAWIDPDWRRKEERRKELLHAAKALEPRVEHEDIWRSPVLIPSEARELQRQTRPKRKPRNALDVLAEKRQEAWSDLGRWPEAWPYCATLARSLTVELNGNCLDLTGNQGYKRKKSAYADDPGGAWADRRRVRFLARSGGVHPPELPLPREEIFRYSDHLGRDRRINVDAFIRLRPYVDVADLSANVTDADGRETATGGRATKVISLRRHYNVHNGESDRRDPERRPQTFAEGVITDLFASGGFHVDSKLAGGDHDQAWLDLWRRLDGHDLEQIRAVMKRRGRLPVELQPVKAEAERVICDLRRDGVSRAQIARVFEIDPKTVTRILRRRLNVRELPNQGKGVTEREHLVPSSPYEPLNVPPSPDEGEGETDVTVAQLAEHIDARLDQHDALLRRVERTLTDVAFGIFAMTGDAALASHVVDGLIESTRIEEEAA